MQVSLFILPAQNFGSCLFFFIPDFPFLCTWGKNSLKKVKFKQLVNLFLFNQIFGSFSYFFHSSSHWQFKFSQKKSLESELLVYLQITLQIKPFPKEMFSNSVGLSKKKC
jgi:hypothetical protein